MEESKIKLFAKSNLVKSERKLHLLVHKVNVLTWSAKLFVSKYKCILLQFGHYWKVQTKKIPEDLATQRDLSKCGMAFH